MSHSSTLKYISQKNVGYKIEIMKWSNRMDLLAIGNDKGEVIVHRLHWQKLWIHPPPTESDRVRGIDWRPDEKIIAVGYSSGLVLLLDIENEHEIHSFKLNADITCLGWTQNSTEIIDDSQENLFNSHETYLPQLPSYNSLSSTAPKTDYNTSKAFTKKVLNILLVGCKSGFVHASVFGVLPCGRINVAETLKTQGDQFDIIDAKMSATFKEVFVTIRLGDTFKVLKYENDLFPTYSVPLLNVAIKHGLILNTMSYISDIILCITEAWETVLLEMDKKLAKYANSHPKGALSADFLELLMFGIPSEALGEFLTRELTEKGLKKLKSSIEISYSTIQKLVIKPLHCGILNICYHLNSIKGMSKNSYYYKPILGTPSNKASLKAGAFLIKSLELQQTIEQSTRDYKIFFGWLLGVIIRQMDEAVPEDVSVFSQQDINYLAEFLNNFDPLNDDDEEDEDAEFLEMESGISLLARASSKPRKQFNLERVGQYLEDKNLQDLSTVDLTQHWNELLQENECLSQCGLIYQHQQELSLVQQHNLLKSCIAELFAQPEQLMSKHFQLKCTVDCAQLQPTDSICTTFINIESKNVTLLAYLISQQLLVILEHNDMTSIWRAVKLECQRKIFVFGDLSFRQVQFYNEDIMSMLFYNSSENRMTNSFVQFPIDELRAKMVTLSDAPHLEIIHQLPIINFFGIIDPATVRAVNNGFDAHFLAVSGVRKVAALLSDNGKRVRLYETDVEEEDDEADMSQNTSLDVSKESNQSVTSQS